MVVVCAHVWGAGGELQELQRAGSQGDQSSLEELSSLQLPPCAAVNTKMAFTSITGSCSAKLSLALVTAQCLLKCSFSI